MTTNEEALAQIIRESFDAWKKAPDRELGEHIASDVLALLAAAPDHQAEAASGPYMRPFHQPVPGMPDLFHTYCPEHPDFGTCTEEGAAHEAISLHLRDVHGLAARPVVDDAAEKASSEITRLLARVNDPVTANRPNLLDLVGALQDARAALGVVFEQTHQSNEQEQER